MALFILNENKATVLSHLSNDETSQLFTAIKEKVRSLETFNENTNNELSDLFETFLLRAGGQYISVQKARKMQQAFNQEPNSITVLRAAIKDFVSKVGSLINGIPLPTDYEWGVRLYVGFDDGGNYGIVIVPAQGLKPFGSNTTEYVEKGLWSFDHPFFALVPSKSGIIYDIGSCGDIIKNKDTMATGYNTEVVSFSWDNFDKVISDFEHENYATIDFTFARIDDSKNLTITIEAFDQAGNPVVVQTGKPVLGICFDQGDLIPPPSPIPDTTF